MIDGVTVSSEPLSRVVSKYTDAPVQVVPNYIDLEWWKQVITMAKRQTEPVTIGWVGGHRSGADVAEMAKAWGRVARKFPNVYFVDAGWLSPEIAQQVPLGRLLHVPWLPLEHYPASYKQIDIACCPLFDDEFNRCKTPIKAMEAGASGCAVVASPVVYGQIIDPERENGLWAYTADEWEDALVTMLEDEEFRTTCANNLAVQVENELSLVGNVLKWPNAWNSMLEWRMV